MQDQPISLQEIKFSKPQTTPLSRFCSRTLFFSLWFSSLFFSALFQSPATQESSFPLSSLLYLTLKPSTLFSSPCKTRPSLSISHKTTSLCSDFSLQNQLLTSQELEVRWLGQVALNGIKCSCKWLDEEACTSSVRRAPHRSGVRLIVEARLIGEAGASSSRSCMGLDLNGPKSWALANGLGFKWAGLKFECFGPKPKASDLSNSL